MTFLFSQTINFDEDAEEIPQTIVDETDQASKRITDPETARELFDQLAPLIKESRPNRVFLIACGMLMEKQRNTDGMLEFWRDLLSIFPEDLTALRMLMRWYRRGRRSPEGIEIVQNMFCESHSNCQHAQKAIVGLGELRAFREVDEMMFRQIGEGHADRTLMMRYIKLLSQQSRYAEAQAIAIKIQDAHKMGQSSKDLLTMVARRSAKFEQLLNQDSSEIFAQIARHCPVQKLANTVTLGGVTLFTGQLGTGGAERQLSRIAIKLNDEFQNANLVGDYVIDAAPSVCVSHANPASGGDFYLPILRRARVRTNILAEIDPVAASDIPELRPEISNLLELLPTDVSDQTRKLIRYFQIQKTKVAYLWQDGGVLAAATAALIAGVPRIVTSFRGLPPNLRPNLMRAELKPLYSVLSQRPEVSFTSNSQSSATAYEQWLDLPTGSISVIPNAIPKISREGNKADENTWADIIARSPLCTKTVTGIFRFDENKRPLLWVQMAAAFANSDPTTRFVLLGSGHLYAQTRQWIVSNGMENRIFLTGIKENVGFYLAQSDLVMHLAKHEGLPNVLIEAHLAGKPVLATPAGGTNEVVDQGVTGHILASADAPEQKEILSSLDNLMSDPNRLKQMGERARAVSEPKYLPENVLKTTVHHFLNC